MESLRYIVLIYSMTEKIFFMESSLLFMRHRRSYNPKFIIALRTSSVKLLRIFSS